MAKILRAPSITPKSPRPERVYVATGPHAGYESPVSCWCGKRHEDQQGRPYLLRFEPTSRDLYCSRAHWLQYQRGQQ